MATCHMWILRPSYVVKETEKFSIYLVLINLNINMHMQWLGFSILHSTSVGIHKLILFAHIFHCWKVIFGAGETLYMKDSIDCQRIWWQRKRNGSNEHRLSCKVEKYGTVSEKRISKNADTTWNNTYKIKKRTSCKSMCL